MVTLTVVHGVKDRGIRLYPHVHAQDTLSGASKHKRNTAEIMVNSTL